MHPNEIRSRCENTKMALLQMRKFREQARRHGFKNDYLSYEVYLRSDPAMRKYRRMVNENNYQKLITRLGREIAFKLYYPNRK